MIEELKARQAKALEINWRDAIPLSETQLFLLCERVYCKKELDAFCAYTGDKEIIRETLRTKVLEARARFLKAAAPAFQNKNNKENKCSLTHKQPSMKDG